MRALDYHVAQVVIIRSTGRDATETLLLHAYLATRFADVSHAARDHKKRELMAAQMYETWRDLDALTEQAGPKRVSGAKALPKVVLERGARYAIEGRGMLRTVPCSSEAQACQILWDEPESQAGSRSAVVFTFSAKRQEVDLKIGEVVKSRYADAEYVTGFRTDRGPPPVRHRLHVFPAAIPHALVVSADALWIRRIRPVALIRPLRQQRRGAG